MPLSAELPVIDNRAFTDLMAEAQTRIPRYTTEWTDFNPGDAGYALVELFAWMTDLLTYRLGQVPLLNYIKFLQLMGIELTPAQPAQTSLVFPVQAGFASNTVPVASRTQVSAVASDGGNPIVFETQRAITAIQAPMDAVLAYDGTFYTDVTALNVPPPSNPNAAASAAQTGFAPFGPLANQGAALLLGFNAGGNFPAGVELALGIWPALARAMPPPMPCGGGASPVYAPASIVWEYWAGSAWQPLKVLSDDTLAFTIPGFVRLLLPPNGQLVSATMGPKTDVSRAWLRARIAATFYETPPVLALVAPNAVAALAVQTVLNEVVGGSNGTPSQQFTLSSTPVIDQSLTLQIDEGSGPAPWTEVDDFAVSGPNDLVYMLDPTPGTITLGDGIHGHIPVVDLSNPTGSMVALQYQFGGGARSNVAAGTALTLMTSIPGIDTANISTPFAAYGGTDEEALQDAIDRAPQALQTQNRAVTAADYELLATQAGPIARAKALPLYHPDFPGMSVPGVVTVIVVPNVSSPAPMPSPGLLRTVCAYLDARRLIATELYVIAPTYIPVTISLQVLAQPDADTGTVELAVEAALTSFLDPIQGGPDGTGWPFGGTIYFVDILRTALVTDVIRVAEVEINLNGTSAAACTDVPIPTGALLTVSSVTATVTTDPTAMGSMA